MSFGQAIRSVWSKYATFSGRAPRSEYWFFQLFVFLVIMALGLVAMATGALAGMNGTSTEAAPTTAGGIVAMIVGLAMLVFILGLIVPSIALSVRRVHDTGASGWFVLLFIIPYVGGLIAIVWGCIPGTPGPNAYGPSPLDTPADTFN